LRESGEGAQLLSRRFSALPKASSSLSSSDNGLSAWLLSVGVSDIVIALLGEIISHSSSRKKARQYDNSVKFSRSSPLLSYEPNGDASPPGDGQAATLHKDLFLKSKEIKQVVAHAVRVCG
jgi:hypothetical protein